MPDRQLSMTLYRSESRHELYDYMAAAFFFFFSNFSTMATKANRS